MISRREFFSYSLLAIGSLVHKHFGAPAGLAPVVPVPETGFVDLGSYDDYTAISEFEFGKLEVKRIYKFTKDAHLYIDKEKVIRSFR